MFPLQWKSEIGVGDILTFLGFLAAAGGLVFTAVQLRLGTRVQRAQFLLDTTERYFADTDVRRLYYDIDYNKFSLAFVGGEPNAFQRGTNTPKPFIGSDEERWLDNLLYTFDVIGRVANSRRSTQMRRDYSPFRPHGSSRKSRHRAVLGLVRQRENQIWWRRPFAPRGTKVGKSGGVLSAQMKLANAA